MTDLFHQSNYKTILKTAVKDLSQTKKAVTLKYLAEKIPVQYTYLSKCLNDESHHLSEDHVFKACKVLNLDHRQTEYVMLLRTASTTDCPERASHLAERLKRLKLETALLASTQRGQENAWPDEFRYLLDPIMVVVHVALGVPEYAKAPEKLAGHLGISPLKLEQVLNQLEKLFLIEREGKEVTKVLRNHIHYSVEHPLTRVHQAVMRSLCDSTLQKTPEGEKYSFMVSFATDPAVIETIKDDFRAFIRRVEQVASQGEKKDVYQLNFDLFKWF